MQFSVFTHRSLGKSVHPSPLFLFSPSVSVLSFSTGGSIQILLFLPLSLLFPLPLSPLRWHRMLAGAGARAAAAGLERAQAAAPERGGPSGERRRCARRAQVGCAGSGGARARGSRCWRRLAQVQVHGHWGERRQAGGARTRGPGARGRRGWCGGSGWARRRRGASAGRVWAGGTQRAGTGDGCSAAQASPGAEHR
jgi:hypothetical protein